MREARRTAQHRVGAEPDRRAEAAPWKPVVVWAGGPGRDQPVQDRLRVRRGRGNRIGPSGAGAAARGDELGDGPNAAAVHQISVSPVRRSPEQEGGDRSGSPAFERGGKKTARYGARRHEYR